MSYINYLAGKPISDGWEAHIKRGSAGGIDYAVPVGTPIKAPADGRVENIPNNGSGGNTVSLWHADGTKTQFMHLSQFVAPGNYKQGDVIGYSGGAQGAPGAGSSTGPHIHWHLVLANGRRVNPLDYVGDRTLAGGLTGWAGIQKWLAAHYGYTGAIDGAPGPKTWLAMQTFLRASYGYTGPLDGVPGPKTWAAVQRWLARYYGYTGAIDGVPGPKTNAALVSAGAAIANK